MSPRPRAPVPEGSASGWREQARYLLARTLGRTLLSRTSFPGVALAIALQTQRSRRPFTVLQIGAQDGRTGDVVYPLLRTERWRGIVVEPRREKFSELCDTYRGVAGVECLNVAVMPEAGEREIFYVQDDDGDLPDWAGGLSSFLRETLLKHEVQIPGLRGRIGVERVKCVTWAEVLERLGTGRLDFLQIDVEGLDFELLRHFPLDQVRPGLVRFEHKHLSSDDRCAALDLLASYGYVTVVEEQDTLGYARQWEIGDYLQGRSDGKGGL